MQTYVDSHADNFLFNSSLKYFPGAYRNDEVANNNEVVSVSCGT